MDLDFTRALYPPGGERLERTHHPGPATPTARCLVHPSDSTTHGSDALLQEPAHGSNDLFVTVV
jgi:hypothetical protein